MKNKGYMEVFNEEYGLYVIQRDDRCMTCKSDSEAAKLFIINGGKLIYTASEMLGMGIIDNAHNRKVLKSATFGVEVIELNGMHEYFYIKSLAKGNKYIKTQNPDEAKPLKLNELYNYMREVDRRHKIISNNFKVLGFIKKQ